jgi:N-glycosylase/DNA lyase
LPDSSGYNSRDMTESIFRLDTPHEELNLEHCLMSGQAFRWRAAHDGWWRGVVRDSLVGIRRAREGLECFTLPEPGREELVREFFRLDADIRGIYASLSGADEHLARLIERFRGLRLLRQVPEEALLSFCCSAANSIPRIMTAVEELSRKYGRHLVSWHGQDFHAFPAATDFLRVDVKELADTAGLGFRGENLACVAGQILEKPPGWLEELRAVPYEQANRELVAFRCIGRKIADCVCLFALDKDEAVPVDTHVRQLAARFWFSDMKAKTVTPAVYDRVVAAFHERYGGLAGWAQQFLFYEDVLLSRERAAR